MAYSVKSMILYSNVASNGNESMDRLNSIYRDELWLTCMEEIEAAESGRIYCRHDFTHLMDVARIADILLVVEAIYRRMSSTLQHYFTILDEVRSILMVFLMTKRVLVSQRKF